MRQNFLLFEADPPPELGLFLLADVVGLAEPYLLLILFK